MAIVSIVSLLMVVGMVVYPRINFNTLYPSIRKTQTVVPTPTLSPEQELYKKSLNGKPMLVDPLDGTNPEQWNTGNGCDFANGTLHSTISNDGSKNIAAMSPCWDQSSNYSNFALKVDYKINQGEMADVLIRGEDPNFPWGEMYAFLVIILHIQIRLPMEMVLPVGWVIRMAAEAAMQELSRIQLLVNGIQLYSL